MNLAALNDGQFKEVLRRHKARDVSFHSPSYKRRAMVRWRLYLEEVRRAK